MATSGLLHIGIKGTALALDRATGTVVWQTSLAGADFVNIALVDGDLYATAQGEVFCLDPATGGIRWKNPLKGFGWGLVSIATSCGGQAVLMREKRQQEEQAAATS